MEIIGMLALMPTILILTLAKDLIFLSHLGTATSQYNQHSAFQTLFLFCTLISFLGKFANTVNLNVFDVI